MRLSLLFFKKYILSKNANSITRKISFLCVLGICVSVIAMVVIVSVMNGFGDAIESRILNFEPHIIIKSKAATFKGQEQELKALAQKLKAPSSQLPMLQTFTSYQDQIILRTVDGQYGGAVARGLEEESLQQFIQAARQVTQSRVKKLSWGEKIESPLVLGEDDIVIGSDLAYQLGVFIGDQVVLTPPETLLLPQGEIPQTQKRTIQDVVRTGVQGLDGQMIVYSRKNGSLFRDSVSHEVLQEVYLNSMNDLDTVLAQISKKQFDIETWRDRNAALFYSLKMEKYLITFFLFLAILIGSFSIITILILLATQKRQEIAVMLTLGMKPKKLAQMFTHIGFFISLIGILGGFAIGLAICIFLDNTEMIQLPDIYYDRTLPVKFVPQFYFFVILLSLTIAFISSYIPARWFTQFKPQDIMRKNFRT